MSTFKEETKRGGIAALIVSKHPCIFQFIQCFTKNAQAPGLHNFLNPREHEIPQKKTIKNGVMKFSLNSDDMLNEPPCEMLMFSMLHI